MGNPFMHMGSRYLGVLTNRTEGLLNCLETSASLNMRLMCLDNATFGIGWAALGARLNDEVFLIPGCDVHKLHES